MDLREIGYEVVNWTELAQGMVLWLPLVDTVG
jgi:hypothetical protein